MEQEQVKFTEFENYIHNKIVQIYGEKEVSDEKEELGSCKIPKKVLNLVKEHNSMKSLFKKNEENTSFQQSQDFYNNLMQNIEKKQKILSNCSRITTKYMIPSEKTNQNKNSKVSIPQNIQDIEYDYINKEELLNNKEEEIEKSLKTFHKKPRPLSTKNSRPTEFVYDSFQKKHMTRIQSAKQAINPGNIQKNQTNFQNKNTINHAFKSSSSKLKQFQLNEKFPSWALERNDFQFKLQCPEFNLNSKILKVCEKQYQNKKNNNLN